jgi:putative DNA primase/helicase
MSVRQITWSASSVKLANENHLHRLKRYIEVRAHEYRGAGAEIDGRGIDVLVIAQMSTEEALNALTLPENADTAHFNAVEGIDKWKGVSCLICIGRTMASPDEVELMAEVLTGKVVERDDRFDGGWYPREPLGIRVKKAGEVGHPTLAEVHPDPVAEAVRWNITEAGLIQAIGRGRGVNRTAEDPLQVDIISTIPLPWAVDEVLAKNAIEPDPIAVMAARGLLVDEKATKGKWSVIQKVLADLYPSEQAARHALKRSNANNIYLLANERLSTFIPATVKLTGARYSVPVHIDASLGDPRETVEKLLRPLAAFEALSVGTTGQPETARQDVPGLGENDQRPNMALAPDDGAPPCRTPVVYLDPPFEPAQPNEPPAQNCSHGPDLRLPELGETKPDGASAENQAHSEIPYHAFVEYLTDGDIPEEADFIEATRLWAAQHGA